MQGSWLDKAHFDRWKASRIYFQLSPFNSSGLLNPRSCVRTVIGRDLFFFFLPGITTVFLVCLFIPRHPFPILAFFTIFRFFCQRNFIPCNHATPFSVFSIAVCHYERSFMLYRYKSRYPRWYIKWRKERENRETIPNELAFINIRFPFNCPLSGNRDRSKWRLHGTFYNHDF